MYCLGWTRCKCVVPPQCAGPAVLHTHAWRQTVTCIFPALSPHVEGVLQSICSVYILSNGVDHKVSCVSVTEEQGGAGGLPVWPARGTMLTDATSLCLTVIVVLRCTCSLIWLDDLHSFTARGTRKLLLLLQASLQGRCEGRGSVSSRHVQGDTLSLEGRTSLRPQGILRR